MPLLRTLVPRSITARAFLIAALWLTIVNSSATGQSTDPPPALLEPGQTATNEIAGGQKKLFEVACSAPAYVNIAVEQRGVDVVARLIGPENAVLIEFDADPRTHGTETIEFVGTATGNCLLSVEPRQLGARPGSFAIRFVESRLPTETEIALDEARRLGTKVTALWRAAKYAEAMPLAERALAIRERELGPAHPDTGQALFAIGNIYSDIPDFEKTVSYYTRAIEVRSKALGAEHISLASIYNNFGVLLRDRGLYARAEEMYQKALAIRERHLESDHLLIASTLNNLASVHQLRGDAARAYPLYRRVLEIRERALGPDHPDVATALNNLVDPTWEVARAEPYYVRALAIREAKLPADHPDIAQTLYNMALLYSSAGDNAKADAACARALNIYEKSLGPEHPFFTYPLNLSAVIAKNKGDLDRAAALIERTISLKAKVQGPYHPHLGGSFANAANIYMIRGETDKAIAAQERANEILDYNLSLNMLTGSERERLAYLDSLAAVADQTMTISFAAKKMRPDAAVFAYAAVLQRKGRVLDALSQSVTALRTRLGEKDRALLDKLSGKSSELARFVLSGPGSTPAAEYAKKLAQLETEREALERELSALSSRRLESARSPAPAAIVGAVPAGAALIEFVRYRPVSSASFEFAAESGPRSKAFGSPRYAAFVVRAGKDVQSVELGDAAVIEKAVDEFRKALRDPRSPAYKVASRRLDDAVMRPVRALLGPETRLLISPEGELNLVPFEALIEPRGKFLVEQFSVTYLTSGRDLLRRPAEAKTTGNAVIVADPAFGDGSSPKARQPAVTAARALGDTYFAPLPGTAAEARSLQALFPDAVSITGAVATESALKKVSSPRVLHLATHGFFLTDVAAGEGLRSAGGSGAAIDNPLLRSGLALAGANVRGSGPDDGILTALEASGLDLLGTKLVVLSACDTGVGEVRAGEGVYGLRRSFALAGAESLVMSLWPVSDYIARDLMTSYYEHLKQGAGRGESLRRAQLEMLRRPGGSHPFYWASFIHSGEWANLDGQR